MATEAHRRSIAKAIIYRGGSIAILSLLTYAFTRSIETMTAVTITYQISSVIGYYIYERLWLKIRWGISKREAQKRLEKMRKGGKEIWEK